MLAIIIFMRKHISDNRLLVIELILVLPHSQEKLPITDDCICFDTKIDGENNIRKFVHL